MDMLCVRLGIYGIFSLVVISMVYAAYPNGCQRECTPVKAKARPRAGDRLLWGHLCAHDLLHIRCFLREQQPCVVEVHHTARLSHKSKVVFATTATPPLCQLLLVTLLMF